MPGAAYSSRQLYRNTAVNFLRTLAKSTLHRARLRQQQHTRTQLLTQATALLAGSKTMCTCMLQTRSSQDPVNQNQGMLDHVTLRVKDYKKAKGQYASALKSLGYSVLVDMPDVKVAGFAAPCKRSGELKADFWIAEAAAAGTHLAFSASKDQVSEFCAAAIAAGFRDNGAPGPRPEYHEHYYAAFVVDHDGNNIEAVSQRS